MDKPKREDFHPLGFPGDKEYTEALEKYADYLESQHQAKEVELVEKYMANVMYAESMVYLPSVGKSIFGLPPFTEKEVERLKQIADKYEEKLG